MNIENMVMLNFFVTVVLAFIAYRQYVVDGFNRQKQIEEIHQEIRNNMDSINRRVNEVQDDYFRDMNEVYRDLDAMIQDLPKKSTKGLNSRIPL
jgi:ferritin-like protein